MQTDEETGLTDAGGDGRTALLVAFSAAVAGDASHAIFAWALPGCLVTGFTSCTNRMAITCLWEENKTDG